MSKAERMRHQKSGRIGSKVNISTGSSWTNEDDCTLSAAPKHPLGLIGLDLHAKRHFLPPARTVSTV